MEWDRLEDLKPYSHEAGQDGHQGIMTDQSALVTRYITPDVTRYEYQTSPEIDLDWVLYSIVVQSPLLRRVLESMLGYHFGDIPSCDSIHTSSGRVEIRAPFQLSLKERLEDAVRKEQDPETKKHLSLLFDVLEENLGNTNKMIKENAANGITYFEDLPLMFKPGTILFTIIEGQNQLLSLRRWYDISGPNSHYLILMCTYVDWQGTRFGREKFDTDLFIDEFEGPMTITDLPIYPLVFHPFRREVEQMLISRGKKFEAHKGYHYRAYNGIGVDDLSMCDGYYEDNETYVNSRVIIDTAALYKLHPEERQLWFIRPDTPAEYDSQTFRWGFQPGKSLNEEQLRLCAPTLRAYSVNDKKWLHIMVDDVEDIEWDDQAFKHLALPQEKKQMILAFANSQIKHEQNSGNVVQGKVNGVIVLCGPPGAGRTLTAEAIAEEMHAPLYTLSAGDLGEPPEEIELMLIKVLRSAARSKELASATSGMLVEYNIFLGSAFSRNF